MTNSQIPTTEKALVDLRKEFYANDTAIDQWEQTILSASETLLSNALKLKEETAADSLALNEEIASERRTIQEQIDVINGSKTSRDLELLSIKDSNKALQQQLWLLQDIQESDDRMNSFLDSMLSTEQLAINMADAIGVDLATSFEELIQLANQLYTDTDLLTEADLALLNINKELLENTEDLDNKLSELSSNISTLEGVFESLADVIDELRGNASGTDYTLSQYNKSMSEALALSRTLTNASTQDELDAYSKAVSDAIDKSSVLFEEGQYANSTDMKFAQLVAANQFESMQDATLDQIDYLKMIEENTSAQIDAIVGSIDALSINLINALGLNDEVATYTPSDSYVPSNNTDYSSALNPSGIGSQYINEVSESDKKSFVSQYADSIGLTAAQDIINASSIKMTDSGFIVDGYKHHTFISDGNTAYADGTALDWQRDDLLKNYTAFADGGIVTSPTLGLIGEAGYNEAIIPLKDPNDPLSMNALTDEVRKLREENTEMKQLMVKLVSDNSRQLSTQRATLDVLSA